MNERYVRWMAKECIRLEGKSHVLDSYFCDIPKTGSKLTNQLKINKKIFYKHHAQDGKNKK